MTLEHSLLWSCPVMGKGLCLCWPLGMTIFPLARDLPLREPLCKPFLLMHPRRTPGLWYKIRLRAPVCPAPTVPATLFRPSTSDPRASVTCAPGCFPPNMGIPCAHPEGSVSLLPTHRKATFWAYAINLPRPEGVPHRYVRQQSRGTGGP